VTAAAPAALLAMLVVVEGPSARADDAPPDPIATEAGEANLEVDAPRDGIVVTFGVGGGMTLGFGVNDSTGTGGAVTLRLARVATRRSLITLELIGSALFHTVRMGMGDDATNQRFTNQVSSALVGAQHYVNQALWLRIAGGFSRYFGDDVLLEAPAGQPQRRGDVRYAGPAGSVGAGLDLLRWKRFHVGAEIFSTGIITRDGILSSNGFLLGFSVD